MNPFPATTVGISTFTSGIGFTGSIVSDTNALGGNAYWRSVSATGGTVAASTYFHFFYTDGNIIFKPGEVFTYSMYVRPSATVSVRVAQEGRHGATNINAGFSSSPATSTFVSCPADTWTRITNTSTVNSVARSDGTIILRFYPILQAGSVLPPGFTFDISNMLVTRGNTLMSYFDGTMPDCSWAGPPYASVSVKNSNLQWYTPPSMWASKTVYNELYNPRFAGGTTVSPYWQEYTSGTVTGSLSTATTNQTITATSLSAGGQYGIYATAQDGVSDLIPLQVVVPATSWLWHSIGVAAGSKHASTDLRVTIELYAANGTTLVGSQTTNAYTSGGLISSAVQASADAHYVKYRVFLTATSSFSGTSSVTLSAAAVEWLNGHGWGGTISGDGNFTGETGGNIRFGNAQWLGAANASKSSAEMRIGKEISSSMSVYDGTNWVTA